MGRMLSLTMVVKMPSLRQPNSSLSSFKLTLPRTTNPRTRQAPSDGRSVSSRNLANIGGAKGFTEPWLRMAILKCVARI